jgi:hypothetical protein
MEELPPASQALIWESLVLLDWRRLPFELVLGLMSPGTTRSVSGIWIPLPSRNVLEVLD